MDNLSFKKIGQSISLFLMALFSLLSLCFLLQGVETTENGIFYDFKENGFDLIDGKSSFIVDTTYEPGAIAMQIVNICILVLGILLIFGSLIAAITQNKKLSSYVFIIAILIGIIYMVEGIVFTAINSSTNDYLSGFYTLSFLPIIFIATFGVAYKLSEKLLPDSNSKSNSISDNSTINSNESKNENTSKPVCYDDLREVKALYDEGILTVEEFEAQKSLILNTIKSERYIDVD